VIRRRPVPLARLAAPAGIVALLVLAAPPAAPQPADGGAEPLRLAPATPGGLRPGETAVLRGGRDLLLEFRTRPDDTWVAIAERYLADLRDLPALKGAHAGTTPGGGRPVAVPYPLLHDDHKVRLLRELFPRDGPRDGAWVHRVGEGRLRDLEENLWLLAFLFTGNGENFAAIADLNGVSGLSPERGREIAVPAAMLLPAFARLADPSPAAAGPPPRPATPQEGTTGPGEPPGEGAGDLPGEGPEDDFTEVPAEPEIGPEVPPQGPPPVAEGAEALSYGADAEGGYAIYRLKRGEALYSAVVVRFTGRLDAAEVGDLAARIARRSGVVDVTDMPIGYRVRIPLDLLLPEYLPREDPRRLAWEKSQAEVAGYVNRAVSHDLKGVAVILDAGHGGEDRGTAHNGVWEHDYVYDILCRIKRRLEQTTGARVLTTIKDRREGYQVQDRTRLSRSRAEILLTDPPYALRSGKASVNLRWYLTNAHYRRLLAEGHDPLKIVFTSLHADARHPSLRGAMVYVPGEEYRRGRYGHGGATYARYREVREKTYVSFTRAERRRSEGLSRQFATALVGAFRRHRVDVHDYLPIRERIIRRGRSWVPAVLRCSEVPVQALLEVSNLSNPADGKRLMDPGYRQKLADAYVDALLAYFGTPAPARPRPATARAR
jgi:N-acetylmuramoyl-L-alanine amidase